MPSIVLEIRCVLSHIYFQELPASWVGLLLRAHGEHVPVRLQVLVSPQTVHVGTGTHLCGVLRWEFRQAHFEYADEVTILKAMEGPRAL